MALNALRCLEASDAHSGSHDGMLGFDKRLTSL